MEELYVFGTGNAQATRCYNTCFAIKDGDEFFMVDAGGGNGILGILEKMNVDMAHIHHIFVTHEHTDHILGIVWMVRMIATAMKKGKYEGELRIYCHPGLADTISTLCRLTLQGKFYKMIGEQIFLIPVDVLQLARYGARLPCTHVRNRGVDGHDDRVGLRRGLKSTHIWQPIC